MNGSTTRREFLRLAGVGAAGASLIQPSALFAEAGAARPEKILVAAGAHPAAMTAAKILAQRMKLDEGAIGTYDGVAKATRGAVVLALAKDGKLPPADAPKLDGYTVTYAGGVVVWGARPRSLIFAASEPEKWAETGNGQTATGSGARVYRRNPDFAIRNQSWHASYPVAEQMAMTGANFFIAHIEAAPALQHLPEVFTQLDHGMQGVMAYAAEQHKQKNVAVVKEFHDADVEVYALLPYGNNFATWSPNLYSAALKAYPTAKGVPMEHSHESAALCPSDAGTWKVLDAFVREWAEQCGADGISATFWDNYSAFCQDERCQANGLNKFPNELYEFISHYDALLRPMGQKLHLRTWSSGCPHWLGTNYVHAPGYGQFGLSHPELWGRVIHETPGDVLMQTKIYHSDCEPDARISTLLGKCKPHTEIVEYQQVGQFIGRQYFAASTVNYTARTLKLAHGLVGTNGGAQIDPGGTMQPPSFDLFTDILNKDCVYAFRELTWNVNTDLAAMWLRFATETFGAGAAPGMVKFLRASEDACTWCWSPLGLGSSTNADFAGNIARREVLLRYTNRNYLPEYAVYLEPTLENVARMEKQQADCMAQIAEMQAGFDEARPHLTPEQAAEVATRLDWFRHFAVCNTTLDVSLWRFRYLRGLAAKLTTDPKQMKELAATYDTIEAESAKLFQYDPAQKMSLYKVPLGQLERKPALGNPKSLMQDIYKQSLAYVMESVGPDYLPKEWLRGEMPSMDVPTERRNPQRPAAGPRS